MATKKKKKPIWMTVLDGAKKLTDAAKEASKGEEDKRAWQKKDCGTPC